MLTGFVLLLPLEGRELSTFNWRNRHKIYKFLKKKGEGEGARSPLSVSNEEKTKKKKNLSGLLIPDVP